LCFRFFEVKEYTVSRMVVIPWSRTSHVILAIVLLVVSYCGNYVRATSQPSGQPTGLPTSHPTVAPTTLFRNQISFNVTLLLHEAEASTFNAQFSTCVSSIQQTLAQTLAIHQSGVQITQSVSSYSNQIVDYNFLDTVENAALETDSVPLYSYLPATDTSRRRKLGATSGSYGSTVFIKLVSDPAEMGYTDTDAAYNAIINELRDTIKTYALTSFLRDQSYMAGCSALTAVSGITPSYVSSFYEKQVLNEATPTAAPTNKYATRRKNFAGAIAGTLLGVTAFIIVVMIFTYYKTERHVPGGFVDELFPFKVADNLREHRGIDNVRVTGSSRTPAPPESPMMSPQPMHKPTASFAPVSLNSSSSSYSLSRPSSSAAVMSALEESDTV
jgi:hypothetical protein